MEMTVLRVCVLLVLLTTTCAIASQANYDNHVAEHTNTAHRANPATRAKRSDNVHRAKLTNRASHAGRANGAHRADHSRWTPLLIGQRAERQAVARQPIGEEEGLFYQKVHSALTHTHRHPQSHTTDEDTVTESTSGIITRYSITNST